MLELSLILAFLSLVLSSFAVFAVLRKRVVSSEENEQEQEENEEENEENEEEEEDTSLLGFPNSQVAEIAVSQLSVQRFNVSCVYCKAKKPAWDVVACAALPVEGSTASLSMVLACPNCATVRLVSPKTLGVLTYDEFGQAIWKTTTENEQV